MENNNSISPIKGEDGRYHYIYLITNKVNGKYYKGVHSTFDLNDGYLGSGTALEDDKEKYGKENFSIQIIKFFLTRDDAMQGENEYITKLDVKSDKCYNLGYGGRGFAIGKTVVKDKNGSTMSVPVDDERLKDGTLMGVCKNMMNAQDKDGKIYHISIYDERLKTGELIPLYKGQFVVRDNETNECYFVSHEEYNSQKHTSIHKNKVVVKDKDGNKFAVDCDDERFLKGELISIHKHRHPVKDKDGHIYYVDIRDERYLSGELVSVNRGRVVVKDKDGNRLSVSINDPRYLSGEYVMHSVGTTNARDKDGNLIRVNVTDERLKDGTLCGQFKRTVVLKNKITGEMKRFSLDSPECNSDEWVNHTLGRIHIKHKITNKIYCVSENDLRLTSDDYMICNDLYLICKGNIKKRILLSEFRKYYNDGWIYPFNTCILYKTDNEGYITDICHQNNKDILPFIENDWRLVEPKSEIVIMKDGKFKYIRQNQMKNYQVDGWEKVKLYRFKIEYIQKVIDKELTVDDIQNVIDKKLTIDDAIKSKEIITLF